MTKTLAKTPFRADIVGSFLRPQSLKDARSQFQAGEITKEDLRSIEDLEIAKLVEKQKETGLQVVTDGEFRRKYWHADFICALEGIRSALEGIRTGGSGSGWWFFSRGNEKAYILHS